MRHAALLAAVLWALIPPAEAAPKGHCMAAAPAGGCVAGPVTDADDILLPGAHVYFNQPTRRYRHGILGDDTEWGRLVWLHQGSATHGPYAFDELVLPQTRVFEDIQPRLADLDGDGTFEVIVIETDMRLGAQLAIYAIQNAQLVKRAATPHIGRTHRWLAPLGAADLDGDGAMELAYIDRPHLARTLRIWRYENARLTPVADQPGLTNHRIGEDHISGGIRHCGGPPEIITANADWTRLMASTLSNDRIKTRDIGPHTGPASFAKALTCR